MPFQEKLRRMASWKPTNYLQIRAKTLLLLPPVAKAPTHIILAG